MSGPGDAVLGEPVGQHPAAVGLDQPVAVDSTGWESRRAAAWKPAARRTTPSPVDRLLAQVGRLAVGGGVPQPVEEAAARPPGSAR